ncbi:MAG: hypothetical protein ACRENG_33985 [bacterium]
MKQALRASVYRQAAIARLAEAEYLKEAHPAGAIYLGGYVVECMLKWAICQRKGIIYFDDLPDQQLAERLTSARGHDLDFLLKISGLHPLLETDKKRIGLLVTFQLGMSLCAIILKKATPALRFSFWPACVNCVIGWKASVDF